jgi:hypothetical protein
MKYFTGLLIIVCFVLLSINGNFPPAVSAKSIEPNKGESNKLLNRIDFGNSYIMGQTIQSGAVYLLHRKQSEIKSMLEPRKDYREEILEDFKVQNLNRNKTLKKH